MKRAFDVCVAASALFVLGTLLVLIAAAIAATDRGPVFIRHRRVGRFGASFPCFKFRTMVVDGDAVLAAHLARDPAAAAEWHRTRKLKADPRVTRLGAVLRKTSLDELPQLFNVLRGEMSIVGPRPIVREEIARYGSFASYYYSVRPGVTGLWQVSGRNDVSYDERVRLDTAYVTQRTFQKDLVILARTFPAVFRARGVY